MDGQTHPLPQPFWVVATQNEVDSYETFPLPHAQLDRFLMSLSIGYPTDDGQVTILERSEHGEREPEVVLTDQEVCAMQGMVQQVEVTRPVKEYIARTSPRSPSEDYLAVLAGQRQWIATTNFAGCPGQSQIALRIAPCSLPRQSS